MTLPSEQTQAFTVRPHDSIRVNNSVYPWINCESTEVTTVTLSLQDSTTFLYASLVGLHSSITKMAGRVASPDADSLQNVLFAGLPSVLHGQPHQGISKVQGSDHLEPRLFVASRNLARLPSLVFGIDTGATNDRAPLVVRIGVCAAADQPKVLSLLGVNVIRNTRRKTS